MKSPDAYDPTALRIIWTSGNLFLPSSILGLFDNRVLSWFSKNKSIMWLDSEGEVVVVPSSSRISALTALDG